MSSRLQLDVRNLSPERRHLVNAFEVKATIGVMQVTLCDAYLSCFSVRYYKKRYINRLTFTFTLFVTKY